MGGGFAGVFGGSSYYHAGSVAFGENSLLAVSGKYKGAAVLASALDGQPDCDDGGGVYGRIWEKRAPFIGSQPDGYADAEKPLGAFVS